MIPFILLGNKIPVFFNSDIVDLGYFKLWILLDQWFKFEISKVYTIRLQRFTDWKFRICCKDTKYLFPKKSNSWLNPRNVKVLVFRALRAHLVFQLLIVALSEHLLFVQCKTKAKKFEDFIIFFRVFSKFYKNKKLLNTNL